MKLAEQIAKEALKKHGNERGASAGFMVIGDSDLESIIAAKLRPMRENLRSLEYLVIADDIALSYLRPVLAMLEDE